MIEEKKIKEKRIYHNVNKIKLITININNCFKISLKFKKLSYIHVSN